MEETRNITGLLDQVIQSIPLFIPELCLIISFLLTIIASLFFDKHWKNCSLFVTLIGMIASFICLVPQIGLTENGFFGMLRIDNFAVFSRMIISLGCMLSSLFLQQHFHRYAPGKSPGDCYSLLLAATLALHLLTMTSNWLMAFIAIEMVSICSYVLVGYFSTERKQAEAAMKYALFGSVCAAVMLYGLSLIYGLTGDLDFSSMQHIQGLIDAPAAVVNVALLFIFVGIGFKLGFVPFHIWSPDVYEGAPTPVTAFLSTVPKVAVLVFFARLVQAWMSTLFYFSELTFWFLFTVAILTMLIGNLAALRQTDAKRLMAYSAIGHTGFLLMAILVYQQAQDYLLFYLAAYVIMNMAAFIFIAELEYHTKSSSILSYSGLGKKMPLLFTAFTLIGISLIGLPPTMGFMGKLLVFTQVFDSYQNSQENLLLLLLAVGALTSVISLFYYFKIPLYAFLREDTTAQIIQPRFSLLLAIGLLLTVITVILGLFPSLLLDFLQYKTQPS